MGRAERQRRRAEKKNNRRLKREKRDIAKKTRQANRAARNSPTPTPNAPSGGYTDLNNVQSSDVLPQYRESMGVPQNTPETLAGEGYKTPIGTPEGLYKKDGGTFMLQEGGELLETGAMIAPSAGFKGAGNLAKVGKFSQGAKDIIKNAGFKNDFAKQIAQNAAKNKKLSQIAKFMEDLPSQYKFSLKGLTSGKSKVDLDYMLRLGSYEAPTPGTAVQIATNTKNTALVNTLMETKGIINPKNKKLLTVFGISGAFTAWASSVFFGKWGQAEAPEPINILLTSKLIPEAERTGNWSMVEQGQSLRDELVPTWLESVALWSPVSPLVGNKNKALGAEYGALLTDMYVQDKQVQQENGESDEEMWARIHDDEDKRFKENVDYETEQFRISDEARRAAQKKFDDAKNATDKAAAAELIEMWAEHDRESIKRAEKAAAQSAQFWLDYKKMVLNLQQSNAPSTLNFGLL